MKTKNRWMIWNIHLTNIIPKGKNNMDEKKFRIERIQTLRVKEHKSSAKGLLNNWNGSCLGTTV